MIKRLFLFALLLCAVSASAQDQRTARWLTKYDLDASDLTYCVVTGVDGSAFGAPMTGPALVETSGSSTTVTAVTASTNPFAEVSVKDIIMAKPSPGLETVNVVTVTAKASADSITVDTAVDWSAGSGLVFQWLKVTCGTGAENGWIDVSGFSFYTMEVQYNQGDLDGFDVQWECRESAIGSLANKVWPPTTTTDTSVCGGGTLTTGFCRFTTPGATARLAVGSEFPWTECRVGIKFQSADASEATTDLESITASLTGRPK